MVLLFTVPSTGALLQEGKTVCDSGVAHEYFRGTVYAVYAKNEHPVTKFFYIYCFT
jgi:hypothetical protein